jgi:hypothetical protein
MLSRINMHQFMACISDLANRMDISFGRTNKLQLKPTHLIGVTIEDGYRRAKSSLFCNH